MGWDDVVGSAADSKQRRRDKWIGVYIGLLAVLLSICSLAGDNASKNATNLNIEATDTWAFFQAKRMRQHTLDIEMNRLKFILATDTNLNSDARALMNTQLAEYKAYLKHLKRDDENEGTEQLLKRGKALTKQRDRARQQDPNFDFGSALLQIAIVLASVAIISGGTSMLLLSAISGMAGFGLMLNGFTLAYSIPFIS